MKNKPVRSGMIKLRRKIVITFLLVTLFTSLLSGILDHLIEKLEPVFVGNDTLTLTIVPVFALLSIGVYILGGIIFYLVVRSAIRTESDRQVKENNLMYASVAHDLKTPLTSIRGFAGALSDDKIPESEKKEIYDIISRKSESMNNLVDLIFDYSQLGTSEYKPDIAELDIAELLRNITADNYCDLEEHGIEVDVHIPESKIAVKGDRRDLTRALSNLIVNTYKHNPSGTSLYIRMVKEGGKCVITMADTGNDIPQGMDIFEPFVTENKARTAGGGTGLGLAITKRIIDHHNGTITLSHDVPGYTKAFIVKFDCV